MTRIEAVFLGTTASIPTADRNHPSIYLSYVGKEERSFLFDCGEATQRQIFKSGLNFMKIDHIFITHWHADHYAGLFGILETMSLEKRKDPLHVHGPEASKFATILSNLGYAAKGFRVIPDDVDYLSHKPEKIFDDNECEIWAAPVKHGIPAVAYALKEKDRIRIEPQKAEKLGLPKEGMIYKKLKEHGEADFHGKKIHVEDVSTIQPGKKIVYSGDTQPCKSLIELSEKADVLIMDCTYFEEMEERHHTNLRQAIEIAEQADVKKIVLTHISRRYPSHHELEKMAKEAGGRSDIEIMVAKDFMKVVVE